jgi:hypothetical protein
MDPEHCREDMMVILSRRLTLIACTQVVDASGVQFAAVSMTPIVNNDTKLQLVYMRH